MQPAKIQLWEDTLFQRYFDLINTCLLSLSLSLSLLDYVRQCDFLSEHLKFRFISNVFLAILLSYLFFLILHLFCFIFLPNFSVIFFYIFYFEKRNCNRKY